MSIARIPRYEGTRPERKRPIWEIQNPLGCGHGCNKGGLDISIVYSKGK